MNDDLLTIEEVALKLKVKKSWVYGHAAELGGYRLGKYWRFSWPRVLALVAGDGSALNLHPNDPPQMQHHTKT